MITHLLHSLEIFKVVHFPLLSNRKVIHLPFRLFLTTPPSYFAYILSHFHHHFEPYLTCNCISLHSLYWFPITGSFLNGVASHNHPTTQPDYILIQFVTMLPGGTYHWRIIQVSDFCDCLRNGSALKWIENACGPILKPALFTCWLLYTPILLNHYAWQQV
jgi:hypothetical protein